MLKSLFMLALCLGACGTEKGAAEYTSEDEGSSGSGDGGGGGTTTTLSGHCTAVDTIGTTCDLYAGYTDATVFQSVQTNCVNADGVWAVAASCPTGNLIGSCALPLDAASAAKGMTVTSHYYPGYTAANAATSCAASEGTYTAAP